LTTHTGAQPAAKLQKNLVLWHIIIIGLAYIQPMTVFDTFGLVSQNSHGHVPTSYIFALVAILLTSISYGHMIKRYPSAGSAYTYAQKSIHPNVGFMVGWSSWLDYLLSPLVNIILADIYLRALFPEVNNWIWVIGLTIIMTIVNLFGARFVALSSLAEETKNAEKVLPRAIFLTALIAGIIFIISTYFMQIYFPSDPSHYFKKIDETQPEILLAIGGITFQTVILYFAIVTVMASGISAHAG